MNPSAAESAYVGQAGQAYHDGKRAVPVRAIPWITRARAELFQSQVSATDVVLEWGCGFGWNLAELRCARKLGHDVAVQLAPSVQAFGAEFVADPRALAVQSCDAIVCHHALEHVPDPRDVLVAIRRLLKPQGRLLLAVPFEQERRYRRFDPSEPNHHLYSWNVQTLGNLLTVAGFQIRRLGLRRYGYDRRAALLALRLGLGEAGFRGIRGLLQFVRPLQEIAASGVPTSVD
ncbi:MAG: class I SAM-dependent methyltransferase [Verrucomicrobia bacterium]|nr:class I SAM-dependent methyltransferase [Verrucomicrobiota bacterium]